MLDKCCGHWKVMVVGLKFNPKMQIGVDFIKV